MKERWATVLFFLQKRTCIRIMGLKGCVPKELHKDLIQTQKDLEEFSRFQKWFDTELEEAIENVRCGIQTKDESLESAVIKIELYRYLQEQLSKQNQFSFELFAKYKEVKASN